MKPSTLIVMSVGLVIIIAGFALCLISSSKVKNDYPDKDLFGYEGDKYEIVDGDTLRKKDFSDVIYVTENDVMKEVSQDVKVLSINLSGMESVEIIGHQNTSNVELYNFTPGTYACQISSGVITLSNSFEQSMIFDYLTDVLTNFNGIRRFFNSEVLKSKSQKVVVNINDKDLLNRIELNFTNCKNVTVKNLTCSLDCKVVLNNSDIVFESCTFKDPEISYVTPSADAKEGEEPEQKIINYFFTLDLNMKNNSSFKSKTCKFSSISALVNKRSITEDDVEKHPDVYKPEDIGKLVSSGTKPCSFSLDLSAADVLYGFEIRNARDEAYASDQTLVTSVNGAPRPDTFLENADEEDYPPISINASNCDIDITN